MFDIVVDEQRYTPRLYHRVLDLGAWYGHFTFYCASRGAMVKAYEPMPDVFAEFAHDLSKHGWSEQVKAINRAISHTGVKRSMFVPENSRSASFFRLGEIILPDVETETLGAALGGHIWDCVKVDIEGAEYEVFTRATDWELDRIRYLTMELHNDVLSQEEHDELISRLNYFRNVDKVPEERNGQPTGRIAKIFCWHDHGR